MSATLGQQSPTNPPNEKPTMNEKTILKETLRREWDRYNLLAVPADCDPEQRKATRRAFYAGMVCILNAVTCKMSSLPAPQALGLFEEMLKETQAFTDAMVRGDV